MCTQVYVGDLFAYTVKTVINLMRRRILRNCWLIKPSSVVVTYESRACQPAETNVLQNKENIFNI